jgi:glycosyltransferase involved in cell wall biosynthesis
MTSPTGFNLVGYTSAPFGIGVAARNTIVVLTHRGYDVAVLDLPLEGGRSGVDHSFDHLRIPDGTRLPHQVTIFHVNPRALDAIFKAQPSWLPERPGFTAVVPFWELPVLPESWMTALREVDLVLCPSSFIEHTFAATLPGPKPMVRHYPQTAFLPEGVAPDRAKYGLPERGVLFALGFDAASDLDRKNPWAAIEAFNRAFTRGEDAHLVIKVNDSLPSRSSQAALARLRESVAGDSRVVVREEPMTYAGVLSLYASCDVYVSLHRSEGFGLCPMEAMLLGKPVIATAWSGTMDFMNDRNACPVGGTPVPVSSPVYLTLLAGKPAVWADPSIDEAVVWMKRLYAEENLRKEIGERAQESMKERQEECLRGEIFEAVIGMGERKRDSIHIK